MLNEAELRELLQEFKAAPISVKSIDGVEYSIDQAISGIKSLLPDEAKLAEILEERELFIYGDKVGGYKGYIEVDAKDLAHYIAEKTREGK